MAHGLPTATVCERRATFVSRPQTTQRRIDGAPRDKAIPMAHTSFIAKMVECAPENRRVPHGPASYLWTSGSDSPSREESIPVVQSSTNAIPIEWSRSRKFSKIFSGPGGGGDDGGAEAGRSGGDDGRSRHDDVSRRDGEGPDSTTLRPRPRFCTSSKSPKVNASLSDFD